jgi:hypothetical protein
MTDVLTPIETGIFDTLRTNSSVAALVGGSAISATRIYKEQAPDHISGGTAAYIVFDHVAGGDENDTPTRSFDVDYQIICWSSTSAGARTLQGHVDTALRLNAFTITGFTVYWCMPGALITNTENDEGRQFYSVGTTWNIRGSQ